MGTIIDFIKLPDEEAMISRLLVYLKKIKEIVEPQSISKEMADELQGVYDQVKELTGYEIDLFRPPYGSYDNAVIEVAEENGYYPVQWSVDSLDWKDYGVDSIINTVCQHKELKPGAIILCHNGAKYTADALDQLLTGLENQGYEIVPISKLILRENYTMDVTGKQIPN